MSKLPTKKSARFRKLLPVVEAKLEEGYSYEEVVEILNKEYELDLTLGVFRNYLYKERKNQNNHTTKSISSTKNQDINEVDTETPQLENQAQISEQKEFDISKWKQDIETLREKANENKSLFQKG